MISSLASFLIDNGLFRLLEFIMADRATRSIQILVATVVARVVSSLFNFFVNRKAVFKSDESMGKTMLKYYALCICQMGVSYGLVFLFSDLLDTSGWFTSLVKLVVDTCLFILSYQIQKRWVFASDKRED